MDLESTLIIVPPKNVQAFAYPLRERYDTLSFNRVPAHIPLFQPFLSPEHLEGGLKRLKQHCRAFQPFELTLDRYHEEPLAVYLAPSEQRPLDQLHENLMEAFQGSSFVAGTGEESLQPLLRLARFENPEEREALDLPAPPCFTFLVKRLHLYLGAPDEETPFIPRAVIPLGREA